ncbi:MAG TPA: LysM domain-containing protein [Dokdonella sp.]
MNAFAPNSRYVQTAVKTCTLPDGREVNYLARRFLPQPDELAQFGGYSVAGGDRLDTVAARAFGDPELFWRLVDGNRELLPRRLVEAVGRALRLTLPAGFPGAFGA